MRRYAFITTIEHITTEKRLLETAILQETWKKIPPAFGVSNKMTTFAIVKQQKDNENKIRKYILVVAPVTTPTVVREQRSYVYM
ncbi:unknown [Bacteroides sp. CAG:633]|nr:unknown [Bacteroides sp. CAG:633]